MPKHQKPTTGSLSLFPEGGATWESRGIFSDHFIRRRLCQVESWPRDDAAAKALYDQILDLWARRHVGFEKGPEETTRREFLEKVLEKLGFAFFSNLDLPEWERRQTPDYFLFPDEQTKELVFNAELQAKYAATIALLEAKKVNHPLDAVSKKEKRFPHQQVRDYLLAATDEPGRPYFRWGILTNGNLWRLYCREARPDAYFQFHLAGPGANFCTFEEFKTFLALFSPSVFVQTDAVCLLDRIRADAVQFQSELEESIRRRVFTVVEDLANGFWSLSENKLTDADLRDLYDNCLILLYRLLFVLYAEGRGLLPVRLSGAGSNTNYRTKYSLKRLIPRLQNRAEYSSDDFAELQEDLGKLFRLINGDRLATNKACSVPPYNGGLFDSKAHPRLEEWRVGDKSLAGVLRDLIFSSPPGQRSKQREFEWGAIDYADLEVRQLGDIYEGLLGGHLEVVQEAGQGRLRVVGERGALQETGTFYTPDWVVRFLVDKTLQPLIDQIETNESVAAAKQAGRKDNSFAREVLKLNIVDPAMGSGHFLVRATEWLADHIVYHPTTEFQIKEVSPGLSQEQAEVSYWRRRVVEACIYGVDINRLAVELAKLSLWLTCIASEEPLNFLDHHLRPGNSLIGAKMGELFSLPPERLPDVGEQQQATLSLGPDFAGAVAEAIREIQAIESESSQSIEIVKDKERRWNEKVRLKLERFRRVANLWVASAAGLPVTQFQYCQLGELILSRQAASARAELNKALKPLEADLKQILDEVKPLHWELEFPDVFHEESGATTLNPGFDAVLGNPPYISTQTSSEFRYREALEPRFGFADDLYVHFVFQGFKLLREGGRFGFIISDTFFTLQTKQGLRELLQRHRLDYLVQCDPFRATVDAAMFVSQKEPDGKTHTVPELTFIQARNSTKISRPSDELPGLPKPNAEPELRTGQTAFESGGQEFRVLHALKGCLRIHRLPIGPYQRALKRCFFEPTEGVVRLYNRLNEPTKQLVELWWNKIETSKKFAACRGELLGYQKTLKPGDITLVGLIAEGGQGMRTANNGRFLGYLDETPQAAIIRRRREQLCRDWKRHPRVCPLFTRLLEEHDDNFEATVEPLKAQFHWKNDLALQKGEIYRIVAPEHVAREEDFATAFQFRKAELAELWSTSPAVKDVYELVRKEEGEDFFRVTRALVDEAGKGAVPFAKLGLRAGEQYESPETAGRNAGTYYGLVGKRSWVPFRKGDPEGNRWLDAEPLYIDWTTTNVSWLWRHSGRPEANMPVIRNAHLYFTAGTSWTLHANHVGLKARLQPACVFDASASRLTPIGSLLTTKQFLAILNTDLFSYVIKRFVKNTQDYEINDLRMAPVAVPTPSQAEELECLANLAIEAKELSLEDEEPTVPLVRECQKLTEWQKTAPTYLQPDSQMVLLHTADHCLAIVELAINWAVERLYGAEGLGPFNEF
jgi:hypothetical protein